VFFFNLNSHDKELCEEALVLYFKTTTVTLQGSTAMSSTKPYEHGQMWWTMPKTPHFRHGILMAFQPLVTKLKVVTA